MQFCSNPWYDVITIGAESAEEKKIMSKKSTKPAAAKTPTKRKARKPTSADVVRSAKASGGTVKVTICPPSEAPKPPKTPEEKAAAVLARETAKLEKAKAREDAKLGREAVREAKRVTRELEKLKKATARADAKAERDAKRASKPSAHLAKIATAASKLPALSLDALSAFDTLVSALPTAELSNLVEHLRLKVRIDQTKAASDRKLGIGDRVTVTAGDPRFLGLAGTVTEARRIRCFVKLDGRDKPVYMFTSDVEPVPADSHLATGTEG